MSAPSAHPHGFGFDAWYPLVRAANESVRVAQWSDSDAGADASRTWSELEPGAMLLVVRRRARRGVRAALRLRGSPVEAWSSALADVERRERWYVTQAPGERTALIEAHDASMRAGAKMLRDARLPQRWTRPMLRAALRFGWQDRVGLDEATLIVKRGGESVRSNPAREWIEANFPSSLVSVSLAEHDQGVKGVIQLAGRDASARAYVKFATDPRGAKLVDRETLALEKLRELGLCGTLGPALLWSGDTESAHVAVIEAVEGFASATIPTASHTRFVEHLHTRTQSAWSLDELPCYLSARDKLRQLETRTDRSWLFIIERLRYLLALHLGHRRIPCSMAHGDFAPWNLVSTPNGNTVAVDWESWKNPAPAMYDLFHFAVQTSALVDPSTPQKLFLEIEDGIRGEARGLFGRMVLPHTNWIFLLGLYLFDAAVQDEFVRGASASSSREYRALRDTRVRLAAIVCDHLSHIALAAPDRQEDRAA